ncbi:hypothetical protein DIPPA_05900 [Diplonema papillatum]|nr:hypothetical protein DIPPA_05900 [Diplonema papillatum]
MSDNEEEPESEEPIDNGEDAAGASDGGEEEQPEEEPLEKEWGEEFTLDGGSRLGVMRVRVPAEAPLADWMVHALNDDDFHLQKKLSGSSAPPPPAEEGEEPPAPDDAPPPEPLLLNTRWLLERRPDTDEYFELVLPKAPLADPMGDAAAEEDAAEKAEDDDEPPASPAAPPADDEEEDDGREVVEIDFLTLVVSQSAACAARLLARPDDADLDGAVRWAAATATSAAFGFVKNLLACISAATAEHGLPLSSPKLLVEVTPLFEASGAAQDTAGNRAFYSNLVSSVLSSGLAPARFVSAAALRRQSEVELLHKTVFAVPEEALRRIAQPPAPADGDAAELDEAPVDKPPALAPFLAETVLELRRLNGGVLPGSVSVGCPAPGAGAVGRLAGVYLRRGKAGGAARYWKGDPVKGGPQYWLSVADDGCWQLGEQEPGGDPVPVCRTEAASVSPLTGACTWVSLESGLPARLVVSSQDLTGKLPKEKRLKTEDVVATAAYDGVGTPLMQSDVLTYVLGIESASGVLPAFEACLKAKIRDPVRPPHALLHLLFHSLHALPPAAASLVISSCAELAFAAAPRASVELPLFLESMSAKIEPAGHLREIALRLYPHVLSKADAPSFASKACVPFLDECRELQVQYNAACDLLLEPDPRTAITMLESIVTRSGITLGATFLQRALVHNNAAVVRHLLVDHGVPPYVNEHVYQSPQPLLPLAIELKHTSVVLVLVELGYDLGSCYDSSMTLLEKVRSSFPKPEADRIEGAWSEKEAVRVSDPRAKFGLLRAACA